MVLGLPGWFGIKTTVSAASTATHSDMGVVYRRVRSGFTF